MPPGTCSRIGKDGMVDMFKHNNGEERLGGFILNGKEFALPSPPLRFLK